MAKKLFTKEELDNIIKDYNNGNGLRPFELGKKYNRNSTSIIHKLKDLGIYKYTTYRFTEEDIKFLEEYYPYGDWGFILGHFPKCNKQSIISKASSLGIKMVNENEWTDEEFEILRKYYKDDINKVVEMLPNRTYKAITTKAKRLGIKSREFWSEEENELMKKYYPIMPIDDVLKYFPNRTRVSIITHAIHLNLQSYDYNLWTKEEDEYILSHWQTEADMIMCKKLGRTYKATQARRLALGLLHFNKDGSGYEGLSKFLRGHLQSWKTKSMENCNYQCVLTGSKNFAIHHMYGFANILNETIEEYNIELKEYSEYTIEELEDILEKFLEVHDKYPLGVCVRKDIHTLYHSVYSKCINNEEQWNQFVKEFKDGVYDDRLKIA